VSDGGSGGSDNGGSSSRGATSPFSVVQAPTSDYIKSGGTMTINSSATGSSHGLVIVVGGQDTNNYVTSCADNAAGGSNKYVQVSSSTCTVYYAGSGGELTSGFLSIFYAPSSMPGATSISCSLRWSYPLSSSSEPNPENPAGDSEMWFYELNQPINGVDAVATLSNQLNNESPIAATSVTTTNPYDWVISGIYLYGRVTNVNSPFSEQIDSGSGNATAYYSTNETTGTYQPTYAANLPLEPWCSSIVAFK
jgi:hypothetical protein